MDSGHRKSAKARISEVTQLVKCLLQEDEDLHFGSLTCI